VTRRDFLPTPERVERDLQLVHDAAGEALIDAYRWSYFATLGGSVTDSAKVRSVAADPTGSIAAGKERMRSRVADAAKKIASAVDMLRSARSECESVLRNLTPDTGYEPSVRHPRTASRADLTAAGEAQQRRTGRGEGFGEG